MSKAELLSYCQQLYSREGIGAFSFDALLNRGSLYWALYKQGLTQRKLIAALQLENEYTIFKDAQPLVRAGGITKRWTWARIIETAKVVKAKEGFLPPAGWFQINGYGSLVQALYNRNRSWDQLREELGDFGGSSFIKSRNGMRWRSHPEASLSNFLYARDIEHRRGDRYPDEYAKQSKSKYGYFDLHFQSDNEERIDVEIWGDKPLGHDEENYSRRRLEKEQFNKGNVRFLGIHYADCYKEERLAEILEPYLVKRAAFRFDTPTDPQIPTTHWSNTDELLAHCQTLAASMPDGEFPTEEWLRKRGKWAKRKGPAYNTVSIYIKTWLGGIRNLRRLLNQPHVSTATWDHSSAISAYRCFYEKHNMTPGQVRHFRRTKSKPFSNDVMKEAARICSAVNKYSGGSAAVNRLLGIEIVRNRKWPQDRIVEEYRRATSRWGMSPNQILYDHRTGDLTLEANDYRALAQLVDAAAREFGGSKVVLRLIGFKAPLRPCRKRRATKSG